MTDERDKSSRGKESLARTTARDVPFMRGAGSEAEPTPLGQRPEQLPRDPTYEAELAQVELAVMRDPARRDDPSTKQGGGRRAHERAAGQPPESVTPESPGARHRGESRSPEPPSSSGRAVASGTLLSVGAVDPRGKTERTLETPRMFFSQPEDGREAYFKPGRIPAVTVHQTLETETVKLADSIDPRRAKTIPRLDRAALARLAALEGEPDSEAPLAVSQPASEFDDGRPASEPSSWSRQDYEAASSLGERGRDGQIHASLSPFRDQAEPSFSLDGAPTRPEPYVVRQASEPPPSFSPPDPSVIPTQRDLPQHRIEASRPPPAPEPPPSARAPSDSAVPLSEGVSPTTASIAAEEPPRRKSWLNYAAFAVALLLAVALGLLLTGDPPPTSPDAAKSVTPPAKVAPPPRAAPVATPGEGERAPAGLAPATTSASAPAASAPASRPVAVAPAARPAAAAAKSPGASFSSTVPPAAAPRKSTPTPRETIF